MLSDHIEHVIKLTSVDHVGIGMDMDGGGEVIGLQDVSQIGAITEELVRRGYSAREVEKIWGGNIMRVLDQVEKGRRQNLIYLHWIFHPHEYED